MRHNLKPARVVEIIAAALVAAAWLLFLVVHAGKLAELMLSVMIPAAAWLYARTRLPRFRWTLLGGALGLAAYPFGRGLFSLIVLPMPFQLLGLAGLLIEAAHGFPGALAALVLGFELRTDTGPEAVFVTFLNGIVWATVYGCIGRLVDRARSSRSR
jgi:hypothetical protein